MLSLALSANQQSPMPNALLPIRSDDVSTPSPPSNCRAGSGYRQITRLAFARERAFARVLSKYTKKADERLHIGP